MTMYIDEEIERIFKRMSDPFFGIAGGFEAFKNQAGQDPLFYGCSMTVGPDGRPVVREYGNAKPGPEGACAAREPAVDVIADEKAGLVKLVAEMPGVEKTDVRITVHDGIADIAASRGKKDYHASVPIRHRVDENSARATYRNGILELSFKLVANPKPKGKRVEVR